MTKGYLMLAQNNSVDDYVLQACVCAMSILAHNPNSKISLVTNDAVDAIYLELFDNIIPIPWTDSAADTEWKVENRWKLYHITPYDETIVLDTDMLILENIDHWWNFLSRYELYFPTSVYTYRKTKIVDTYYRKAFVSNNLPNIYVGFHYFKKCDRVHEFYKWVEDISNNWELFYGQYCKTNYPKRMSMDITCSIAVKIMNCENEITNKVVKNPTFVHMKPYIQDWNDIKTRWQDKVGTYLTPNLKLMIGNHLQSGVFHYTENDFITDEIVEIYKNYIGLSNE